MKKLKKVIVQSIIRMASFFFSGIKYRTTKAPVLVNLGCGLKCLPNWINIDGSLTSLFGSREFPFINRLLYRLAGSSDYYSFEEYNRVITECDLRFYDLSEKVPLADKYADAIYCSHFLEHLTKDQGTHFLAECYRALKQGGLLRISVPDLDHAFRMYQQGEIENMMGLFFYTSDDWDFAAHKYGYNFDHLKKILERTGFKGIRKMSYQKGECPGIEYLDIYPDHSLFVECRK